MHLFLLVLAGVLGLNLVGAIYDRFGPIERGARQVDAALCTAILVWAVYLLGTGV